MKKLKKKALWFFSGAAALFVLCYAAAALVPYPELDRFRARSYGRVINDRNGVTLRVLPASDGVKRERASIGGIPPGTLKVFIRAEDRRFYFHPGIDLISIAASAVKNLRAGRIVRGASTITMQLARLVSPRGSGFRGKIVEARNAVRLEAKLSKKEILELWFNNIPFGSNIEGVPAAARARFGRPARELDDSRAALLAVIPRRPGLYDPFVNQEAALSAALDLSRRAGLGLSEENLRAALEPVDASLRAPFFAPHFTERAAALTADEARALKSGQITTTLDLGLQTYAEDLLRSELTLLARNRVSNGAVFAVENKTGEVRVYAGSASWFNDEASGKIDGIKSRAQPGSCLKPFLYAMALDSGFSPSTVLPDLPSVFGSSEAYFPTNFNQRFNGPVRFRVALASSLNVPAVHLLERLGVSPFEDYLVKLGFGSIAETKGGHGTGLALGNAEVSLEELVRAFAVFPRGGVPLRLKWLSGDDTGNAKAAADEPVMSAYAALMISDILSDKASRFIGFGPAPSLTTPFASMFKTGTANQYQHIWALGASRDFTVGVWMGNFSGETVVGRTGSSIPARIASKLLTALEESKVKIPGGGEAAAGNPGAAAPFVEIPVCALSGMAAGPYCTSFVNEKFREKNAVPRACTWHTAPGLLYPPEYQAWHAERFRSGGIRSGGSGTIRMPLSGSVFYAAPGLPPDAQALRIETAGFTGNALLYLDGALRGSLNHAGLYSLPLFRGKHTLIIEDENGSSASVDFEVR